MATVIEHGVECDGYQIIVRLADGEVRRLHATKRPEDIKAWANAAEAEIVRAKAAEAASIVQAACARKREALTAAADVIAERAAGIADPRERDRVAALAASVRSEYGSVGISADR